MGSVCGSSAETVDTGTHQLTTTDTGTLIYASRQPQHALRNKSLILEEDLFFGFNINYSEIDIKESIGHGTYGQVFKARYKRKKVALKKIYLSDNPVERNEILEDFSKEVKILSILVRSTYWPPCGSACSIFCGALRGYINSTHSNSTSMTNNVKFHLADVFFLFFRESVTRVLCSSLAPCSNPPTFAS